MNVPDDRKYTNSHEWILVEGKIATVGITDHAQSQMGDIVYVELPDEGDEISSGEAFASLESVKAASDCYIPVDGTVAAINSALEDAPQTVNEDAYGEGWMVKIELSDIGQIEGLMSAEEYSEMVAKEEG